MSDLRCEEFEDLAPELALGVLAGNERAAALEHLALCPQCREHLDELVRVGDSLLLLAPETDPPIGFESLVMARLVAEGAAATPPPLPAPGRGFPPAADGPLPPAAAGPLPPAGGPPPPVSSQGVGQPSGASVERPPFPGAAAVPAPLHRRRPHLLVAGIAAALILVAGLAGLLVGRGTSTTGRLATVRSAMVWADDGTSTCRVVAFAGVGHVPTVVAIHLDESNGLTASYPVLAQPARGGPAVPVGAITVRGGQGSLLTTVPAETGKIRGIVVVWPDGALRYQATFAPV